MKKLLILLSFLATTVLVRAQGNPEEAAVKKTIDALFDGMRNADTALAASAFADKCIMQTIAKTREGKVIVRNEDAQKFAASIGGTHPKYDERIQYTKILIDGELASVWTDYKFYLGDKFSHCGVNFFQLMKTTEGWKIIYIVDTRRKDNCVE